MRILLLSYVLLNGLFSPPAAAADLHQQAIAEQRAILSQDPGHTEARQQLAEIGWQLAAAIEAAEALEQNREVEAIARQITTALPDIVWRTRHNADNTADPRAQLAQAVFLRRGILMAEDPGKACNYYRKLAQTGDPLGNWQYSRCLQSQDQEVALQLARTAAGDGHPAAMQYVAEAGLTSKETEVRNQAIELLKRAAATGRPSAVLLLGALHETGTVVRPDLETAARYYRQIAEQGHSIAQNNLGALLQREGRLDDAARWYQQAAESQLPVAQLNLGLLLASRNRDDCEAVRWIRSAANAGLELANRVLSDPAPYQIECTEPTDRKPQP